MVGGSPMAWPMYCTFWFLAKRVRSGMLMASVDQ